MLGGLAIIDVLKHWGNKICKAAKNKTFIMRFLARNYHKKIPQQMWGI
ncbi:MAG: hypothetical protein ACI4RJ_05945 [Alphaproteobacteria bacterium]